MIRLLRQLFWLAFGITRTPEPTCNAVSLHGKRCMRERHHEANHLAANGERWWSL
jgi:hypothetical protein